jgi:hypothetical protein
MLESLSQIENRINRVCLKLSGCIEEGAGAGPSQRTGTRLGGVVSSRDCRLAAGNGPSNKVKTVSFPCVLLGKRGES